MKRKKYFKKNDDTNNERKISIIPFYNSHLKNELFKSESIINRDNCIEPFINLKNKFITENCKFNTYDITSIKKADYCIFFSLNIRQILNAFIHGKLKNTIYYQTEPPVVTPLHSKKNLKWLSHIFGKVLSWNDDIIDNKKFYKLYYPIPELKEINKVSFAHKKLITTILGNKSSKRKNELYSKRLEIIEFFQEKLRDKFEFYGVGWAQDDYPSYKGKVKSKVNVLKNYKFVIAYENQCNLNGLISEKIFDCFFAKTVPIYWGANNITDYVPKECFIDRRDFLSNSELLDYINKMTEKQYILRLEVINKYMHTEEFKKFLHKHFSHNFYEVLINTPIQRYNILKAFFAILRLSLYTLGGKIMLISNKILGGLLYGKNSKKNIK